MTASLQQDRVSDDVLDIVYDVALDPAQYEDLASAWENVLWPHIPTRSNAAFEAHIASHFARAEGILDQLAARFASDETPELSGIVESTALAAALVFNKHLQVAAVSSAGTRLLSITVGMTCKDLPILSDDVEAFEQQIQRLFQQDDGRRLFLRVRHQGGEKLIVFQLRVVRADSGERYIAAVSSDIHWPEQYQEWLGGAYGLSNAECDIVRLIVDCKSITEIAQIRDRSVGTVRNQVKSILAKTGSRSQTELVRLAMSIMEVSSEHEASAPRDSHMATSIKRLPPVPLQSIVGPDGRRLDYLLLGDPHGAPVFYLQTELGLTRLPKFIEDEARNRGLCVVSPIRAGFGHSDPVPEGVPFATQVAQDLLTVMDHMGITSVPFISMAADNTFPGHMHILRPGSVSAIIATSGCYPFVNDKQAARQHATHRLMHSTARYFPRFLPFVAKASFAFIRKMGKDAIIKLIFKNSPHDLELFEHPDVRDAVLEGSNVGLSDEHSAHEAFILQCLSYHDPEQLTVLPRLKADGVPYHSLNGLKDPSMHADTVAENQEKYSWINFHIYPEAGQWLFFQHPNDVFDLVEQYPGA